LPATIWCSDLTDETHSLPNELGLGVISMKLADEGSFDRALPK
jgi:hypothetical protein